MKESKGVVVAVVAYVNHVLGYEATSEQEVILATPGRVSLNLRVIDSSTSETFRRICKRLNRKFPGCGGTLCQSGMHSSKLYEFGDGRALRIRKDGNRLLIRVIDHMRALQSGRSKQ